jgi:hypothetical protein
MNDKKKRNTVSVIRKNGKDKYPFGFGMEKAGEGGFSPVETLKSESLSNTGVCIAG